MASSGISVGAFVLPRKLLNGLRLALRDCNWLKPGANITPFAGHPIPDGAAEPYAALHASPLGAETMEAYYSAARAAAVQGGAESNAHQLIPAEVWPLLRGSAAYWVPGLRVGSPACAKTSTAELKPQKASDQERLQRKRPHNTGDLSDSPPAQASPSAQATVGSGEAAAAAGGAPAAFTFSELFAGVGGFRVALEQLGGRSVFSSEIDFEARAVLARSFAHGDGADGVTGSPLPCGDITEVCYSNRALTCWTYVTNQWHHGSELCCNI
jgi:hypothetical protein